ncbi:MAG: hypothetical protein AAGF12_32620 [Myxococcota bacterium]
MFRSHVFSGSLVLVSLFLALGCSSAPIPPAGEEAVACEGKCDAFDSVRTLYRDGRDIDSGDLMNAGSRIATDALNDTLAADYFGAEFDAPEIFALDADAVRLRENRFENTRSLEQLTTGLGAAFGEQELTTQVNAIRTEHLRTSRDEVFAEAAFRTEGGLGYGWNLDVGGLSDDDGRVRVGFASGALEGRVINAYDREWEANTRSLLDATLAARGFLLPRDVSDLRDMKPGELFALRGDGWVGLNAGAGVPILLAEPASNLTYNLVVSGVLRSRVEGTLDIQAVRMTGDEVVVDVGIGRARDFHARIAATDGWGASGLLETHVDIGGVSVDLGRLLERTIEKQLRKTLDLVGAEAGVGRRSSRLTVARFSFRLDQAGEETEAAIAQALRGDVRLAQLLAQRGDAGVTQVFDVLRSGVATTSYAGINFLGMSFYQKDVNEHGEIFISTPAEARTIMFQRRLADRRGFFSRYQVEDIAIAGLAYNHASGGARSEANLFLQIQEGDVWLERDKLLDHLDALLWGIGGEEAFHVLEERGNTLQAHVQQNCEQRAFNPCFIEILETDYVQTVRREGLRQFAERLPSEVDAGEGRVVVSYRGESTTVTPLRALLLELADMRLTAQATFERAASVVGPESRILTDVRLTDQALDHLFAQVSTEAFEATANRYLRLVRVRRADGSGAAPRNSDGTHLERLSHDFELTRRRYRELVDNEHAILDGYGAAGTQAVAIAVPVRSGSVNYDAAVIESLVQRRAALVQSLFHRMVDTGNDFRGARGEQLGTYLLLALTPPALTDVRVDIRMDLSDDWSQSLAQYRASGYRGIDVAATGVDAELVGGGMFQLDRLLDVDQL